MTNAKSTNKHIERPAYLGCSRGVSLAQGGCQLSAVIRGIGVPARALLLEEGSGAAMLGLAPGYLLYQCCPLLQAIMVHLMHTLIMASYFMSDLRFVLL